MARRPKMTGLQKLQRTLAVIPDLAKKEIAFAMERGANEVVNLAKSLVSVEDGVLKDSIGWTWGNAPKGSIALGTVKGSGRFANDMRITIFAGDDKAFYARWVEFGTSSHKIDVKNAKVMIRTTGKGQGVFGKSVNHPGAKASPFFYPSYRALRKRIKSRISRGIKKAAKNSVGK